MAQAPVKRPETYSADLDASQDGDALICGQRPDSLYEEVSNTISVQTKRGDDDGTAHVFTGTSRPGSAGTTYSNATDLDDYDPSLLTKNTAQSSQSNGDARQQNALFIRRATDAEPMTAVAASGFVFEKPTPRQLDFVGARQRGLGSNETISDRIRDSRPMAAHKDAVQHVSHQNAETGQSGFPSTAVAVVEATVVFDADLAPDFTVRPQSSHKRKRSKPRQDRQRHGPVEVPSQQPADDIPDDRGLRQAASVQAEQMPEHAPDNAATIESEHVQLHEEQPLHHQHVADNAITSYAIKCTVVEELPNTAGNDHGHDADRSPDYERLSQDPEDTQALEGQPGQAMATARMIYASEAREAYQPALGDEQVALQPGHELKEVGNHVATRPYKRRKKNNRKSSAFPATTELPADPPSVTLGDYFQILAVKVQEQERDSAAKFDAEKNVLLAKLGEATGTIDVLQTNLDELWGEKQSLDEKVEEQVKIVNSLLDDLACAKKFGEGLKNDLLVAKKAKKVAEAGTRKVVAALEDVEGRRQELAVEMNKIVGQLSDEKDSRVKWERQLTESMILNPEFAPKLTANIESIVAKLEEMQEMVGPSEESSAIASMAQKTLDAVQALDTKSNTTSEGLSSVSEAVASCSQRLSSIVEQMQTTRETDREMVMSSTRADLEEAIRALRSDINNRDELVQQNTAQRVAIANLENEFKQSCTRVKALDVELKTMKEAERRLATESERLRKSRDQLEAEVHQLRSTKDELQSRVRQLTSEKQQLSSQYETLKAQSAQAAHGSSSSSTPHIQSVLDEKVRELLAMTGEREEKMNQLQEAAQVKSKIQEEVQGMTKKNEDLRAEITRVMGERESLIRANVAACQEAERKAHSMVELANNAHIESTTKRQNEAKSLKGQLQSAKQALGDQIAASKKRVTGLDESLSAMSKQSAERLEAVERQLKDKEAEAERLNVALRDAQGKLQQLATAHQACNSISTSLAAEKSLHRDTINETSRLVRQVTDLEQGLEAAQKSEQRAQSQSEAQCREKDAQIQGLSCELQLARDIVKKSEGEIDEFKASVADLQRQSDEQHAREMAAVQEQMQTAQHELQTKDAEVEKFQAEVQQAWEAAQHEHKARCTEIATGVTTAEAKTAGAIAEAERLRIELQELKDRIASLSQGSTKGGSSASKQRVAAVTSSHRGTPTGSDKENESPALRGPTIQETHMPSNSPRTIAYDSYRSQSNLDDDSQLSVIARTDAMNFRDTQPSTDHSASHISLSSGSLRSSMRSTQAVKETQYPDKIPTFAHFKSGMTTSPIAGALQYSSSDTMLPPAHVPSKRTPTTAHIAKTSSTEFSVYDESQAERTSSTTVDETQDELHVATVREQARWSESQERAGWTDTQLDENTLLEQPAKPKPNSASKMMPREDVISRGGIRQPSRHSDAPSERMGTLPREGSMDSETCRISSSVSSAPDFIKNSMSTRKKSTYGASGTPGGSRRRSSRTDVETSADPRLAGRTQQPTPKRKSARQVFEGYEHERKKRVNAASSTDAATNSSRRRSSRSGTQVSTSDVPMFSHNQSARSGSGSQSQSQGIRSRNDGADKSRKTRSKNPSKHDAMNARFSQEL